MTDHRIPYGCSEAIDPGEMVDAAHRRRIHWWFVCVSALIILLFMGWMVGVVIFATRTNDHDGLIGLMLLVVSTMMLYPMMPVYVEIVQDRGRR